MRSSDLLDSEILSASDRLSRFDSKKDSLQTKKARLDGLTRTLETNLDDLMEKISKCDTI